MEEITVVFEKYKNRMLSIARNEKDAEDIERARRQTKRSHK